MNFDFKVTIWERLNIDDAEARKIVLADIKAGKVTSGDDIYNHPYILENDVEVTQEIIHETSEQMSVEENGGSSTIEVIDGQETIYFNGEQ